MLDTTDVAALVYDWNDLDLRRPRGRRPRFVDETIRDGLQSPSVRDPSIEQKMELVRLMDRLGIHVVNLGLPGAGRRAQEDVEALLRMIVDEKLRILPNCAARTVAADITPIIDISQRVGVPIEITAEVRRKEDNKNAGFKLVYESPEGFKTAGHWYTIPDNERWHTAAWRIEDPCFVNYWGYNFALVSDGDEFNQYYLRRVTVRKAGD